jgi:hypothetical protein
LGVQIWIVLNENSLGVLVLINHYCEYNSIHVCMSHGFQFLANVHLAIRHVPSLDLVVMIVD